MYLLPDRCIFEALSWSDRCGNQDISTHQLVLIDFNSERAQHFHNLFQYFGVPKKKRLHCNLKICLSKYLPNPLVMFFSDHIVPIFLFMKISVQNLPIEQKIGFHQLSNSTLQ